MGDIDARITHRMRDRIKALLMAGGYGEAQAHDEANSLCDGLGYYERVKASNGLRLQRAYDGLEVLDAQGKVVETIPFDRIEDRD